MTNNMEMRMPEEFQPFTWRTLALEEVAQLGEREVVDLDKLIRYGPELENYTGRRPDKSDFYTSLCRVLSLIQSQKMRGF